MCLKNSKTMANGVGKKWNLRRQIPAVTARLLAEKKNTWVTGGTSWMRWNKQVSSFQRNQNWSAETWKKTLTGSLQLRVPAGKWQVAPARQIASSRKTNGVRKIRPQDERLQNGSILLKIKGSKTGVFLSRWKAPKREYSSQDERLQNGSILFKMGS